MKNILTIVSIILFSLTAYAQGVNLDWANRTGGGGASGAASASDVGNSITTDINGNVYSTGLFNNTVDFDPGVGVTNLTSNGGRDFYIQKLDANGNFLWAKSIGGSFNDVGFSITTDNTGNVYITGIYTDTADFDPGFGVFYLFANGAARFFILKLNSSGNFLWAKGFNNNNNSSIESRSITTDPTGNVIITGVYSGTVDFDPGIGVFNLTPTYTDCYILKLNSLGNFLWAKTIGGIGYARGMAVKSNTLGDLYITGNFSGTVDFDPGIGVSNLICSSLNPNVFILKLNNMGNLIWAKNLEGSGVSYNLGWSITVDNIGGVYVSGQFRDSVDFDPGIGVTHLYSNGLSDIFILKLNASGNFLWAKSMGSYSNDFGSSITTDTYGNSYTTGMFWSTVDFDPGIGVYNLVGNGYTDIFILKLNPAGSFLWARNIGGSRHEHGRSITTDSLCGVYITGVFEDTVDFDPGTGITYLASNSNGDDDIFVMKICQSPDTNTVVLSDSLLCQYDTINLYLSDTNCIDSLMWSFGDTISGNLNTSTDLTPSHVYNVYGTYPIEVVIYAKCIVDTIFDTIRINPTPIANLGNDTILCEGDSMQLLFNDTSFNYLWNTGDTSMSIQILHADTFTIAISSICGVDYDTIVIDSLIPALVHLPNDTLMCDGDSLLLDATIQSGSYLWSNGDTLASLWATMQDTFWVAAMNFCGSDTDTIVVNYTHPPLFDLGNDTSLCAGDTLILFAGDTLSSVLWFNGDTTNYDTITTSGIYTVTTTNLCGSYSDTIEAWFLLPPTANLGNDTVICVGDSVLLSDTTLFGNYAWSTGSVADTISILTPGSYQLTVTNICGVASDTIGIDFDTIPLVNLGNDTVICNGNSVFLDATFSRAQYLWNTGSIDSAITATTEGYYWAITTNLCGADTDSVHINVDSILIVDLGPDTILCSGDVYPLHSNVIGDSYLWSTGVVADSIVITSQSPYSLTVTNVCGSFNDTIDVFYDNSPITNLGPDSTYCLNSLVNLNAYWSRAEYLWNTADTTSNITANYSGQFWVMVTNLCGFDDDTVKIAYDIPISFSLGLDTVLCVGDSILLSAPAHNANWVWNSGNTDSTLVVNGSGYYEVSATNICGTFTDGITIIKETIPVLLNPVPDTSFCEGLNYEVSVLRTNSTAINWQDGSTAYNRSLSDSAQYVYTLKNICGTNSDSFNLHVEFPTNFSLGNDTVLCYSEEITKTFQFVNHSYLWNNGSTDNFRTITRTGVYGVSVLTPEHCESYDEFEVTDCNAQLFIPNAFTPGNGDDLNNTFKIKGIGIRAFQIVIYDRWGQQVFESTDLDNSWDGTSRASSASAPEAPAGVYTYKIWYNTGGGNNRVSKLGVVNLIR